MNFKQMSIQLNGWPEALEGSQNVGKEEFFGWFNQEETRSRLGTLGGSVLVAWCRVGASVGQTHASVEPRQREPAPRWRGVTPA